METGNTGTQGLEFAMILLVSGSTVSVRRFSTRFPKNLGHLLTPNNRNSVSSMLSTGLPWAADNGCFSGFNEEKFKRFIEKIRGSQGCLFVVVPDVIGNMRDTLSSFDRWSEEVRRSDHPIALVGQDGCGTCDVPWDAFGCWFIGGSTAWKLSEESKRLAFDAKDKGKWLHMGRVNSEKRIRTAHSWRCDSVDGTSASMFGDVYIPKFCSLMETLNENCTHRIHQ